MTPFEAKARELRERIERGDKPNEREIHDLIALRYDPLALCVMEELRNQLRAEYRQG